MGLENDVVLVVLILVFAYFGKSDTCSYKFMVLMLSIGYISTAIGVGFFEAFIDPLP